VEGRNWRNESSQFSWIAPSCLAAMVWVAARGLDHNQNMGASDFDCVQSHQHPKERQSNESRPASQADRTYKSLMLLLCYWIE
jgi:hypothetical protein